jgi:hypothetical protein
MEINTRLAKMEADIIKIVASCSHPSLPMLNQEVSKPKEGEEPQAPCADY